MTNAAAPVNQELWLGDGNKQPIVPDAGARPLRAHAAFHFSFCSSLTFALSLLEVAKPPAPPAATTARRHPYTH